MASEKANNIPINDLQIEYGNLRTEIIKRIELRYQIMFGTLTIAGVLFSFGLANPAVAFVYPTIAMFLSIAWSQNDISVKRISKYIRENIEPKMPGLGWESYMNQKQAQQISSFGNFRFIMVSASGVYLITEIIAIFIGFSKFATFTLVEWILGLVAIAFTLITLMLLIASVRRTKRLLD